MAVQERRSEATEAAALILSKRGAAFIWLGVLCIIVVMGLFYIVLDQPIDKIQEKTKGNFTGTQYQEGYDKVSTMWDYFLFAFLLSILAFGVLTAMTRENG